MARRRTISVGPPNLGLADFPEHMSARHCTQAVNVEFGGGGVATRRGTRRVRNNLYQQGGVARDCTVKLVAGFSDAGNNGFGFPMTAVGLVPTAGADAEEQRLLIVDQDSGVIVDQNQLHAPNPALVNAQPVRRWDSCMFRQAHRRRPDLVVCTDHFDGHAPTVHTFNRINGFAALTGVDRTVNPFHTVVVNPTGVRDDPGDYSFMEDVPVRARFCRSHRGRLALGHWFGLPWKGPPIDLPSTLWFSNYGDAKGWTIDNIIPNESGDTTPITGLGDWQRHIVVFREGSVSMCWVPGPTPEYSVYRQVVADRGCVAHATILDDVEGMTVFLAADGLYGFRGTSPMAYLSEPIERSLRARLESSPPSAAWAVHHPWRRQVWLALPDVDNVPDIVFVMDYGMSPPAWSMFEFQTSAWNPGRNRKRLGGAARTHDGTGMHAIGHRPGGTIDYERMDVGDFIDDQDAAIEIGYRSLWESGPVQFGKGGVDRWRYLRPTIRPTGAISATGWWRRDGQRYDETALNSQSASVSMAAESGGNPLGAFVLGTDPIGAAEDHQIRIDVHSGGVGRYGRIGLRTSGTAGHSFDVRGFEIDVLDKEVRR